MYILTYFIIIVVSLIVLMEVVSIGCLFLLFMKEEKKYLENDLRDFHPIFRRMRGEHNCITPVHPSKRSVEANPYCFDPHAGYRNKPGKIYARYHKIGSDGFICNSDCDELTIEKPDRQIRVFVFGGSSVTGSRVKSGSLTISGQLEVMLNKLGVFPGGNVRVVNASVSCYSTFQDLIRFVDVAMKYDMDMVVFFNGLNDFIQWKNRGVYSKIRNTPGLLPNWQYYDYLHYSFLKRVQSLKGSILHAAHLFNDYLPILHYSTIIAKEINKSRHLKKQRQMKALVQNEDTKHNIEKILYSKEINSIFNYVSNLEAVAGIARIKKIKGLFCLQPILGFQSKKDLTEEEKIFFDCSQELHPNISKYFKHAKEEISKRASMLNDEYVRFLDMTQIFKDTKEQVYADELHFNAAGNRIIAETLLKNIIEMMKN